MKAMFRHREILEHLRAGVDQRLRHHRGNASDSGQTALVAVVALTVIATSIGGALVMTVIRSYPLQQQAAVQIYAHRALEAGENAYLTAINANPSLAQCSTNTNGAGVCTGINYGEWNKVANSDTDGADAEYYAFGNPQPDFDKTTNALDSLSVEVAGAARDNSTTNNYLFNTETLTVTPSNGFLDNVWWSNFESYSSNGDYSHCNYNWNLSPTSYDIDNVNIGCTPVYFGPGDYLFGPVYTNDSVFVSGDGRAADSPSFGTATSPSAVTTADPDCLFVDDTYGMSGSPSQCNTKATGEVALYDSTNSSHGHAVEEPPATDAQLATLANLNGCLYAGPTQVTLSQVGGVGKMTVSSPDTPEPSGTDSLNAGTNTNNCPSNGTADLPSNGVVFVENASAAQTQSWSNPFDDPIYNSVTNITSSPSSPQAGHQVTLTATVTSGSNQLNSGATVSFSQTTKQYNQTTTSVITGCSAVTLTSPVAVTSTTYQSTATCPTSGTFTESSSGTGAFSAAYSGGTYATSSSGSLGQTNSLSSSKSYGPDAQVTAGGCSSCYYGETSSPNAEGDAFVNGALSGQLTIGTANDVIVDGPISYADCAGQWETGQSGAVDFCPYFEGGTNDSLGLIADNYAEVNRPLLASTSNSSRPTVLPSCAGNYAATCDPSDGTDGLTIDSAILALTQSFVVNNYTAPGTEGSLNVYGSIQQYGRGPVGQFSGDSITTGYLKHYTWDPLLNFVSPPSYLVPSTPSWVLENVDANAGTPSTDVCPPLLPVYGSSQEITQYCSAATGGLPDYPSITAPSPPSGVSAVANANGTVTVTWTDPPNNGSTITGYTVSPSPQCASCTGTTVSGAGATSATISGLTPGTYYSFSVTATNSNGTGDPSAYSNSVAPPTSPSAPTSVSATLTGTTVKVGWTNPNNNGSPITSYTVIPSPTCSTCTIAYSIGSSTSTGTVSGLAAGTSYTFTVTATNGVGTGIPSASSNSVTTPTVPGAPTIGTATAGTGQATVKWTTPSNNGGSSITGYVVTPYIGATAQTSQTFVSTATTEVVTGLTNGSAYTFKVAATNAIGTGSASAASNSVTPAGVPGAPTSLTVTTGSGSGKLSVGFTAPSSNGSPITSYTVTATDQTFSFRGGQTATGSASPITVSGLHSNDLYTFTVTATNAIGTGPSSVASSPAVKSP
jgi:Fibronectin type III domain